jgi:hypothetical protein
MKPRLTAALLAWTCAAPLLAQAPLPFPGAATPPAEASRQSRPASAPATAAALPAAQAPAPAPASTESNGPAAATVVFPIFPSSKFLGSYDAGKGQRYYLYGTTIAYADVVAFYRNELKDRGDEVFAEPPTHMFSQKFKEDAMAFPPGVTVKDWTYQSKGYPNPKIGALPERFPTIVMIVPPPPGTAPPAR